jgi:hypothetical protein
MNPSDIAYETLLCAQLLRAQALLTQALSASIYAAPYKSYYDQCAQALDMQHAQMQKACTVAEWETFLQSKIG